MPYTFKFTQQALSHNAMNFNRCQPARIEKIISAELKKEKNEKQNQILNIRFH